MNLLAAINERIYRTVFRRLIASRPFAGGPISLSSGARVLVFSCAGIGDTLTDSVVFKALAESYPGIHLAGVVHRRRRALLEHNPYCKQVFGLEKGPLAFHRLHRELKQAGPWDAILQLRGNDPEPRCQSFLLAPEVTVSVPNMTNYGWLCGHTVQQPDWDDTHGVLQTLRLAQYVGADTKEPHLVYRVSEEESRELETRLAKMGVGNKPRLVLQIGGGRRAHWRDWPIGRLAELVLLLNRELQAELLVLGGADNRDRAELLAELLTGQKVVFRDLVGKLSLKHSAALLKSARALVTTDTGIMHLGFAVGTRVVALIHCNNPAHRVGPYGYGDRHRVLQLARPENYKTMEDADMSDIGAEAVLAKVKEVWT